MRNFPIKICRVRDPQNIATLCELNPEYIGLDFRAYSPHYLGEIDEALLSIIPNNIRKIGLFGTEEALYITYIAGKFGLSGIQLEGEASTRTCEILAAEGLEIIKTLSSIEDIEKYEGICNKFLVRDRAILAAYNSRTPLFVDHSIWQAGKGYILDTGDGMELRTAYKNIKELENIR